FRKVRHLTYKKKKNANLRNSNFSGKVLTGVNFTGSDLSNAYLAHIDFTKVIFFPSLIIGAVFDYSNLSEKNLSDKD
ncbi:pentapeptide repeat-containing protein, partial [Escherichia coli]|uniref:pentapeptide repeat-containing protein n=1 Tax=Escherichia coli TaxID=562 RepID=UPI001CDB1151